MGAVAGQARENLALIAGLDLALAKARHAESIEAVKPEIAGDFTFKLARARHPLLGDDAVPIDIRIGGGEHGFRALVVTGPNTGGKTVALKCVGLLHLMAACGLHVPAGDGTRLAVYTSVYADIGDEQSIEQSLSTFSSHMTNLVEMVREADSESLVLADEIGAGTDPIEGASLAQAIVERLLEKGCAIIATTHFGALANFASANPLVENASVNFAPDTLSPTYEISIGLPGRSGAAEIASRLGLDGGIVARARELAGSEYYEAAALIDDIRRRAAEAGELRQQAEEAARRAEDIRARADDHARAAARRISDERKRTRRESRRLVREIETLARKARKTPDKAASARLADIASRSLNLERRLEEVTAKPESPESGADETIDFHPGDQVAIRGIRGTGEVLSVDISGRETEVAIGPARMRVSTNDLRPVSRRAARAASRRQHMETPSMSQGPVEADIRGMRAEEAPYEIDRLIDLALREGRRELGIVHGSGTGALRSAVRRYLADHPLIKSYSDAGPRRGGSGFTVAAFRD